MKRIVSLLLALAMLFTCAAALADDFGVSIDVYMSIADQLNQNSGMEADWIDRSEDRGYPSMQIIFQSLVNNNSVHLYFDPIIAVESVYAMQLDALDQDAQAWGFEFGQMLSSAVMTVWMAQHMTDEDLAQQLELMTAAMEDEMNLLLAPLMVLDDTYTGELIRQEGTFCGYPAVFEMEADAETGECTLYLLVTPDMDLLAAY